MMVISIGEKHVYLAVYTVCMIGFTEGCVLSWTSPVFPKLLRDDDDNPLGRVLTNDEISWLASLYSIGGMLGAVLFGFISEKFGRKIGLIANLMPHITAFFLFAFGKSIGFYYAARVLGGMGIGAGTCSLPIYIGEVAGKENRGFLSVSSTVFIMGGCLFSYCVGPYTSILVFNIILVVFPISALVAIIICVPESPYFLVQKGRTEEGLRSLQILRGSTDISVDKEFEYIKDDVSKISEGGVLDIFKSRAATRAFIICTVIVTLHNFSGIYIVLAYTELIFEQTGSNLSTEVSSIIVGATQFATVFLAPPLAERMGRKPLFYLSLTGIIVNLVIVGAYLFVQDQGVNVSNLTWIPLVAFVLYFGFYNAGVGCLPFTLLCELYPLNVKSAGTSISIIVYFSSWFGLNYSFNSIVDATGMGGAFWIFAGICCGTVLFVYFCVIETKGKSLQEIQDILAK